jgi:hypothetical protein
MKTVFGSRDAGNQIATVLFVRPGGFSVGRGKMNCQQDILYINIQSYGKGHGYWRLILSRERSDNVG